MSSLINSYGVCNWFPEYGDHLVLFSELPKFSELKPNGKIFQCIGVDDSYLHVKYGERAFHIKPELYKVVLEPKYKIGDNIKIKGKKGVVCDIEWHFAKSTPLYFVAFDGKKSSKRYFDQDFCEMS